MLNIIVPGQLSCPEWQDIHCCHEIRCCILPQSYDLFTFHILIGAPRPSITTVYSNDSTSFEVGWTFLNPTGTPNDGFQVRYCAIPAPCRELHTHQNSYHATGLTPATTYLIEVRAKLNNSDGSKRLGRVARASVSTWTASEWGNKTSSLFLFPSRGAFLVGMRMRNTECVRSPLALFGRRVRAACGTTWPSRVFWSCGRNAWPAKWF